MVGAIMEFLQVNTMEDKYTFHVLGLAHLPTSRTFGSCAFTQKNIKLVKMLISLGHKVYLYGARASNEAGLEEYIKSENFTFVETHTIEDIRANYGEGDNTDECNGLGYKWRTMDFKHDLNAKPNSSTIKFYLKAIEEINKRKKDNHFLLCTQGTYHKIIADSVKLFLTAESGIGYRGSVRNWFRSFESSYIQNYTYGYENDLACANGNYYDRVIPNYFDPEDIKFSIEKKDYYLFIGRLIKRKGIMSAYLATKAIGAKLIIAGQGGIINENGHLVDDHPQEFDIPNDSNWEYVGYADIEKRKELMAGAIATFVPTEYLEIFGGVHIESMLSGTPVITTDFGVFGGNTFVDGVHGFKCNTLDDFAYAAKKAKELDPIAISRFAEQYLMDNVKYKYERWFDDLYQVFLSLDGKQKGWHNIRVIDPEWRSKIYDS